MKAIKEYNRIKEYLLNNIKNENDYLNNNAYLASMLKHPDSDVRMLIIELAAEYNNSQSDYFLSVLINDKNALIRYWAGVNMEIVGMEKSLDALIKRIFIEKDIINKSSFLIIYSIIARDYFDDEEILKFIFKLKSLYKNSNVFNLYIIASLVIMGKKDYIYELINSLLIEKKEKKIYEILLALKDVFVYYSKYDSKENNICLEIKKYLEFFANKVYKNSRINIIISEIIN